MWKTPDLSRLSPGKSARNGGFSTSMQAFTLGYIVICAAPLLVADPSVHQSSPPSIIAMGNPSKTPKKTKVLMGTTSITL
jgi:hypothetical protein